MRRSIGPGTVVAVVGASSGIGRLTALEFARRGAHVVLAARSEESLEEVASECRESGAQALVVPVDLARPGDVERVVDGALERFGRLDVWVSAASVFGYGTVEQMPRDVFRRIVEVNLFGTVEGVRAALPVLRRRGGTIVLVGSVFSEVAAPYVSAYVASKHAIAGFARALRAELSGTGVDVAVVLPATIDTPIYQHASNHTGRRIRPMPPVVAPDRVARSIVHRAERPRARTIVGLVQGSSVVLSRVLPGLMDRVVAVMMERLGLEDDGTADDTEGTVFQHDPGSNHPTGGWGRSGGPRGGTESAPAGQAGRGGVSPETAAPRAR